MNTMTELIMVPSLNNAQAVDAGLRAAEIREGDHTRKFRFTDRHGNEGMTFKGADLFDLLNIPMALVRQLNDRLNDELPRILEAIKDWARQWQEHIEGWELYPREGAMQHYVYFTFVVTHKGKQYDDKLAEGLSRLDVHLHRDLGCSLIRVTTIMVPDVSEGEIASIWV